MKLKIGVVGCGRIFLKHNEAINFHNEKYELIALCDNNIEVISHFKNIKNIKVFKDYDEFLNENLDLVSICTPSGLHAEQTILASNKKIDVLTEKPMALNNDDANLMVKTCKANNTNLFVVKQNRYNPTIKFVKNLIERGLFGRIIDIDCKIFWCRPQSYYDQAAWRGTVELDGGALMNQASHYIDLLRWLFGPIVEVQSMVTTTRNIDVEDSAVINFRWKNGAIGSMNVSMLSYEKNIEGSISIIGEYGTLIIGGIALNKINYMNFNDKNINFNSDIINYETSSVYGNGHIELYKFIHNFYSFPNNSDSNIAYGEDGLETVKIILSCYKSSIEKKSIFIES